MGILKLKSQNYLKVQQAHPCMILVNEPCSHVLFYTGLYEKCIVHVHYAKIVLNMDTPYAVYNHIS